MCTHALGRNPYKSLTEPPCNRINDINSPQVSLPDNTVYILFYILMVVVLIIYTFWLFHVLFRAISERNRTPLLSIRLKFFSLFTFIVLAFTIVGLLFGVIGPVQNNAAQLLSFLSLFNLYVYGLAFVYMPSRHAGASNGAAGMVRLEEMDDYSVSDRSAESKLNTDQQADNELTEIDLSSDDPGQPTSVRIRFGERPDDTERLHSSDEDD